MASKWRGSAVEGAVEWTRRRLGSPFTNLRSYSFANQAKQCGWGCSEIDVAATWIFQRKFVPYPYYIRTISPYLYDIRTTSVRHPCDIRSVHPPYVRTASLRHLYGICAISSRTSYRTRRPVTFSMILATFPILFSSTTQVEAHVNNRGAHDNRAIEVDHHRH